MRSEGNYLAINEFDVMRALSVAVASTILRSSLVTREPRHASVGIHLDKVERAVQAAREVGHVNVESELLVLQFEQRIGAIIVKKINAGSDILVRALGNEIQAKRTA